MTMGERIICVQAHEFSQQLQRRPIYMCLVSEELVPDLDRGGCADTQAEIT